jgi:hypothetical protein
MELEKLGILKLNLIYSKEPIRSLIKIGCRAPEEKSPRGRRGCGSGEEL